MTLPITSRELQPSRTSELPSIGNSRLGIALALVMGVSYGSFLLAGAMAPALLARPVIGSIPWSFLLSAGLLVEAVATTGLYVLLTNAAEGRK